MRAVEQQEQRTYCAFATAAGSGVGVVWGVPAPGQYEVRLTEPGAKLLSISVVPGAGATQFQLDDWNVTGTPPKFVVRFLSPAGATGNYGGTAWVYWRKGQA